MTGAHVQSSGRAFVNFDSAVHFVATRVSNPIECGPVPHTDGETVYGVISRFAEIGVAVRAFPVIRSEWASFCAHAGYAEYCPGYAGAYFPEKSLEHFIAHALLQPAAEDTLIDIVPDDSPFGAVVNRISEANVYSHQSRQIPGDGICVGGDPCTLPLPDGFASKASLISVLNSCEGDTDSRLFKELARVVRPGGKVVVVPLYMYTEAAVQSDPACGAHVPFDPGIPIYCVEGWGNRHSRFYCPQTLLDRIMQIPDFRFTIYHVLGTEHISGDIFLRFALTAERI